MALLEASGLKKYFSMAGAWGLRRPAQAVRAVDGVDLSIEQGETLGLVGESGCGKSTLGRCLLRLVEPTEGRILFDGQDLRALPGQKMRALRRRLQIVFQDPFASLDPRFRVGDTLDEALAVHQVVPRAERAQEVRRLLAGVGLPSDAARRFPHEFSGGQRQRIGIARALAVRPDFLVADEAVSALDVSVRGQILELLRDIQAKTHIGMLFIGHDLGVIRQVSHRVAVMYLGKIVEAGPTSALYEDPRHPYTRALLAAIPSIVHAGSRRKRRPPLEGDVPSPIDIPTGCRFHTRCPFAQEICRRQEPALAALTAAPAHRSACHFAETMPAFERG